LHRSLPSNRVGARPPPHFPGPPDPYGEPPASFAMTQKGVAEAVRRGRGRGGRGWGLAPTLFAPVRVALQNGRSSYLNRIGVPPQVHTSKPLTSHQFKLIRRDVNCCKIW